MELLVVIAIIALLASMLLPALMKVRDVGRKIKCVSNLRQIGMAALMYVQDSDGWWFFSNQWNSTTTGNGTIYPYLSQGTGAMICPSGTAAELYDELYIAATNYGCNPYVIIHEGWDGEGYSWYEDGKHYTKKYGQVRLPCKKIIFTDSNTGGATTDKKEEVSFRHLNGANFLFADGHVEWISEENPILTNTTASGPWMRPYN